jgi:plastocyanin
MTFRTFLASAAAVSLASISCSSSSTPSAAPADVTVAVTNYKYTAENVTIKKGQTVEWVFQQGSHDVNSGPHTANPDGTFTCTPDGKFASGDPQSSGTYRFTFNDVGTFPYFCTPHCNNQQFGTVTVTP